MTSTGFCVGKIDLGLSFGGAPPTRTPHIVVITSAEFDNYTSDSNVLPTSLVLCLVLFNSHNGVSLKALARSNSNWM
jgi:hypothetical protein